MKSRNSSAGFTLVELMVTVVVLAILVALAAPSFADLIDRNRLKSQMEGIVDVLQFAKTEAMKRSATTSGSAAVSVVIAKGANNQLWTVTATHDAESKQVTGASGMALLDPPSINSQVTLTYSFRGIVTGVGGIDTDFTLQSPRGSQLRFRVNAIGRVAVCSPGGGMWGYASC